MNHSLSCGEDEKVALLMICVLYKHKRVELIHIYITYPSL